MSRLSLSLDVARRRLPKNVRVLARRLRTLNDPHAGADITPAEQEIIDAVAPYTLTSPDRLLGVLRGVEYLVANDIEGDVVECGVFKGGSVMAAALQLKRLGDTGRDVYLYDTFEGMPAPDAVDVDLFGKPAQVDFDSYSDDGVSSTWVRSPLDDVRDAVFSTGYPQERFHFVRGMVEETIPGTLPDAIGLLRLDTDWYASTRHELEHLYPRLVASGVLIVDDYGHYDGCRRATDEYLATLDQPVFLARLDYTGRLAIKPAGDSGGR